METEEKKNIAIEFEGNWNIVVDENKEDGFKIENESDEEESDWSDMEEVEELRKQFKEMRLVDQERKKKNFKEKMKNKVEEKKPLIGEDKEVETTEQRLIRFGINLGENETMTKIGVIEGIINGRILIQSVNNLKLEPDNHLFASNRQILGEMEEILGSVKKPKYLIKIDDYLKQKLKHPKCNPESGEISTKEGQPIFAVSRLLNIMNQDRIEAMSSVKGSDCNNNTVFTSVMNDLDLQFSDDEREKEALMMRKKNSRKKRKKRRKLSNSAMSTQSMPIAPMNAFQTQGMVNPQQFVVPNFQPYAMTPNGFMVPISGMMYPPQGQNLNFGGPAGNVNYLAMSNQINQMYGYNVGGFVPGMPLRAQQPGFTGAPAPVEKKDGEDN